MRLVGRAEMIAAFRAAGPVAGGAIERRVRRILDAVRRGGAPAVREWTRLLDGTSPDTLEVPRTRIERAASRLPRSLRRALDEAARRIRAFAAAQRRSLRDVARREPGISLGHRVVPLARVGAYVPGGRYPLVSTALMTVIPARVAGVREIVVVSPPRDGEVPDSVLAATAIAGADRVFRAGGAQAVGLLAYGVEGLEPVDRIVGPGNAYVTCAKRLVAAEGRTSIDMNAGPTELLAVADGRADPDRVAANLLAQAEHDPDARVGLIVLDPALLPRVEIALARRLGALSAPGRSIAAASLCHAVATVARDEGDAAETCDAVAPEHLWIDVRAPDRLARSVNAYGSLFIGPCADVALGDYVTGPNHTLPTGGAARWRGGLWVGDFLRVQTYQRVTSAAHRRLAPAAAALARAEGLLAHAASLERPTPVRARARAR